MAVAMSEGDDGDIIINPNPRPLSGVAAARHPTRRSVPYMPINGPGDYLSTTDAILAHWTLVNTALGATPLVLSGAYALATLQTDRTALATQITAVTNAANNLQAGIQDRDLKRAAIREKIRQFGSTVKGLLPGSIYAAMVDPIPRKDGPSKAYFTALDDIAGLWNRINTDAPPPAGFTPPLILSGYTRANFVTDQTALNTAFTALAALNANNEFTRKQRDLLFAPIKARLVQYRTTVTGRFPAGHPLIASLPAISPRRGRTPDAVSVSGMWDNALLKARITHAASADPDLASYSIRACFGDTYRTNEEVVIGTNPPGTLAFLTDEGLVASGSTIFIKVYVVLTTGNEKGSRAIKIVRA